MCIKDENKLEAISSKQLLLSFSILHLSRAVINGQLFFKHSTGGRHIVSDREKLWVFIWFLSIYLLLNFSHNTVGQCMHRSGCDGGKVGTGKLMNRGMYENCFDSLTNSQIVQTVFKSVNHATRWSDNNSPKLLFLAYSSSSWMRVTSATGWETFNLNEVALSMECSQHVICNREETSVFISEGKSI